MNPPVRFAAVLGLLASVLWAPILAQTQDENTRLMQEYMARRAEWIAFRTEALDKIKAARDEKEKKALKERMETDEQVHLRKMSDAGKAYQDARQKRIPAPKG